MDPLRKEIRETLHAHGGEMTVKALQQMEKLDSYMKEILRVYTPGYSRYSNRNALNMISTYDRTVSFQRKVLKGVTLSNGQHIPQGSRLQVASYAAYHDLANYPDPNTFDGLRAYKQRQSKRGEVSSSAHNQFVSVNEKHLGFGYGRHACPGRFFAANEIKMIVAQTILAYDIKMPEDRKDRWPNLEFGAGVCFPLFRHQIRSTDISHRMHRTHQKNCYSKRWRYEAISKAMN